MQALVARGWEVVAASPSGAWAGRFGAHGVRHVPYYLDRSSFNPLTETRAVAEIAALLRRIRPDLLHTFAIKPNIYGGWAAALTGVPARVATVCGLGSFYVEDEARRPAARPMMDVLYRSAMKRVQRMVFANADDLAELTQLGICRPGRGTIVPESVDIQRFTPSKRLAGGPLVVSMVARLIRDKGVGEFLDAAEILKARWGDRVTFRLAGETDPGNPWSVDETRLADAAARGTVELMGFVQDIPALLRETDIYVLPSYYREGTPVSVLEAMSAGLAVVTTNGIGCRETVIDGESGFLVPVRNAQALAQAIEQLIADESLRARFGAAARRRVEERFANEKIVAATLAVYRELLPESFR